MTLADFKIKADIVHNNKYNYDSSVFISSRDNITIICPEHGEFEQRIESHLNGNGCRLCKKVSKGEIHIRKFLIKYNIEFEYQKSFKYCRRILPLRFDFYLPDYQLLIEYDGRQHFEKTHIWNNENFEKRQKKMAAENA